MRITRYIVTILLLCAFGTAVGQSLYVKVTQPFIDTMLCKGSSFYVNFICDTDNYFLEGNMFKVQLSDANGNFSNPTEIGQTGGIDDGYVFCTIPSGIASGTGYRLRVVSSLPAQTSSNNGKNIRISPYPVVTASNNSPTCPTGTVNFSGNSNLPNGTYAWTGPQGFSSGIANPVIVAPGLAKAGIYTLAVTVYGCTSYDTTLMTIADPPQPWIRPRPPGGLKVCEGASFAFDAQDTTNTPGVLYKWTGPNGFSQNTTNFDLHNVDASDMGYYAINIIVGTCVRKDSVLVTMITRPDTAVITTNSPVCMGDTLKLQGQSATPNVIYAWAGPANFADTTQNARLPNITAAGAGTYTATAIHKTTGCASLESTTNIVVGNPLFKPLIFGDTILCGGDMMSLLALSSNSGGIFNWNGPTKSDTGKNFTLYNANPADAGTYQVVQKRNGCTSPPATTTVSVTMVPKPTVSNSGKACAGELVQLSGFEASGATYRWSGPAGFVATEKDPKLTNTNPQQKGRYKFYLTINNCTDSAFTDVVINPVPRIDSITGTLSVCNGDSVLLFARSSEDSSSYTWRGPDNYTGNGPIQKLRMLTANEGTYHVKAEAKGCVSEEDSVIIGIKPPPAPPQAWANSPVAEGETLTLKGTCPTPDVTYRWTGPQNFDVYEQDTEIKEITALNAGTYIVTATNAYGCGSSASVIVVVSKAKKSAFKIGPNPSGGTLILSGLVQTERNIELRVVNAGGQIVYEGSTLPQNKKIYTTLNLHHLATGTYTLHILTENETESVRFVLAK